MKKYISILALFMICGFFSVQAATNPANTGLAFLKIGIGGRAVGLGNAYTAVANDASATYWNPAGLAQLMKSEFMFTHNSWFQDISHDFFGYTFSRGSNAFGVSFISTKIGGIERRVKPSNEPLGYIDARDFMVGLSYARPLGEQLLIGITIKYLYEKIYVESSYGIAGDIGVLYGLPVEGLTLGLTVQNLGKMSEMRTTATELPALVRSGIAYQLPPIGIGNALIAADVLKVIDGTLHVNMGMELVLKNIIALRGGYLTGYDDRGLQAGFGVELSRYRLDYAYAPFSSDIGNSHRISLGIVF